MEFEWDENHSQDWTKEQSKRDDRFDFAAFLGPDSLDDLVTDVLDGKDLLDENTYRDYSGYVPRVPFDGEHGRHEAPGSGDDEEEDEEDEAYDQQSEHDDFFRDDDGEDEDDEDTPDFDARFQASAPPRPKIVVTEPTRTVYVDPRQPEYSDYDDEPVNRGMGSGQKWMVSGVISLAVVAVVLAFVLFAMRGGGQDDADPTPSPTSPLAGLLDRDETPTPKATDTPAPIDTPAPGTVTYNITVTSGSGGSVSPSGAVKVVEATDATFYIQPDSGYELSQLLVDGVSVTPESSYTFTNVRADHTIYAVFQPIPATAPPTQAPTPTPEPTAEPTPTPTPEPTATPEPAPEPEQPAGEDAPPAEDEW